MSVFKYFLIIVCCFVQQCWMLPVTNKDKPKFGSFPELDEWSMIAGEANNRQQNAAQNVFHQSTNNNNNNNSTAKPKFYDFSKGGKFNYVVRKINSSNQNKYSVKRRSQYWKPQSQKVNSKSDFKKTWPVNQVNLPTVQQQEQFDPLVTKLLDLLNTDEEKTLANIYTAIVGSEEKSSNQPATNSISKENQKPHAYENCLKCHKIQIIPKQNSKVSRNAAIVTCDNKSDINEGFLKNIVNAVRNIL